MKLYNTKFYHRDLSWLRFNHRVLQEAADKRNPLYERIKFLAIFSSNLDEFFKVRVSDIRQIKNVQKPLRKKLITKPNKVLREIKKQVDIQQEEFGDIFRNQIIPDLEGESIYLIDNTTFDSEQRQIAIEYFKQHLVDKLNLERGFITPKNSVFVENECLYLTAFNNDKVHIVKIPKSEPRFFTFPDKNSKHYITFIDDILKVALNHSFNENGTYYAIKVSRDAELYIEDEYSGNLMKKIQESLPKREHGQPTRILVDKSMPESHQELLKKILDVSQADFIQGGTYHNFKDFFAFPNPTASQLNFDRQTPLPHPFLSETESIFELIQRKDQLVHYPYQSFEPVIKLIETASQDPSVTTIKMTLYRMAEESRLNSALLKSMQNGKEVTLFIEAKARFDEANNIKWGTKFKEAGGHVIYSYADIKVHSKLLYIERIVDENKTKRYAFISTGNFNEKTAKIYTDFGLMTAHKKITKEIHNVFMTLEGKTIIPKTNYLLVSPYTTRYVLKDLIDNEKNNAMIGNPAWITLKMNSLQDETLIEALYEASNAGVNIHLIVRGICCLVPGIKEQSENITVTSIVDRYLEHSRVYIFSNNNNPAVFIGSADWMTRNLDHRIEVLTPILDEDIRQTIMKIVDLQVQDNVKARFIDKHQSNTYVTNNDSLVRAQYATYDYLKSLS